MRVFFNKLSLLLLVSLVFSNCKRPDEVERGYFNPKRDAKSEVVLPSEREASLKVKTLTLASWNIQHLGQSKSAETLKQIALLLRDFDIVAVQEVVAIHPGGAKAVAQIADELNRLGAKWDYQISDPTKSPSSNISERYAYFWKTSKVQLIHRAYLDKTLEELCYREPFVAQFKSRATGQHFYIANYHGRSHKFKPQEEIGHLLDYPDRLNTEHFILAGDFNLSESHKVWQPFYLKGFKNALSNQKTTLRRLCKEGDYLSHSIDNLYSTAGILQLEAGAVDIVKSCENLAEARLISDHLPIYLKFALQSEN